MIKVFFEEIFPYEKFPVEYECYKQINSAGLDINYLAIPWTQILNSGWLNFPNKKTFQYYISELYNTNLEQKNNITVCQHDDYMKLENIFRHLGITTVFSTLHNKNNKLDGINIVPISFTNNFKFENIINKDILFSFVGAYTTHSVRQKMFNKLKGPNIIYRDSYHVDTNVVINNNHKKNQEEEYKSILQRSRFSLCPRGSSPSSVRFWESLAAGAIPILISDDWDLPDWNWSDTTVNIPEKEFEQLDYNDIKVKLFDISDDREEELRKNCLLAYEEFKRENFLSYIIKTNEKYNK